MANNTAWIAQFCNGYAPLMVSLAKLFIYVGLVAGVIMAAAEVYKLYREARAIRPPVDGDQSKETLGTPAAGEVIKNLVGLLTGAKAWLALVILGVLLLWLAGNSIPEICKPQCAGQCPPPVRTPPPPAGTPQSPPGNVQ